MVELNYSEYMELLPKLEKHGIPGSLQYRVSGANIQEFTSVCNWLSYSKWVTLNFESEQHELLFRLKYL